MINWFKRLFRHSSNHKPSYKFPKKVENFIYKPVMLKTSKLLNFSEEDVFLLKQAINLGNEVLNSQEFFEWMSESKFNEDKGFSGKEIWEMLIAGYDSSKDADYTIELALTMYTSYWSSVVGYTTTDSFKIWVNKAFFKDAPSVIGNIVHESIHNLGFNHLDKEAWKKSVPYSVGYKVEELAQLVYSGGRLNPYRGANV